MYVCMVCNTLVRRNSPGWLLLQLKLAINQDPGISIDFRYFMKCIWKCLSMALTTVGATIYLKGTDRLWHPRVLIWSFACTVIGQMCVDYGFWQHKYIVICAGIVSVSVCTNTVCCSMGVHWLWFYIAWVCGDHYHDTHAWALISSIAEWLWLDGFSAAQNSSVHLHCHSTSVCQYGLLHHECGLVIVFLQHECVLTWSIAI